MVYPSPAFPPRSVALAIVLPILLSACSSEATPPDASASAATGAEASASETAPVVPVTQSTPVADPQAQGRRHQYTSLNDCRVIREEREEMPFVETECTGSAGWNIRISDSDARQRMSLVAPGGAVTKLALDRIGGGAFSSFGSTAEWRGAASGDFAPDGLVVRYNVAENPHPTPETSYLLAVRLEGTPCIVRVVSPMPGQNDSARGAADSPGDCTAS